MSGKKKSGPVRACLVINARSTDHTLDLAEILPVLGAQGWETVVREKHEKGDAATIAREAADEGYDPIVNCGGDGTLNEIVGALVGTDVAVGTIPGGTANVWSKQVGIAQRSRVAALQLAASARVPVDVGVVEVDGKSAGHFLMMAGLGADGGVMQRASRSMKNRLGPLAVGIAAIEAIPSLRATRVEVEMDGARWEGEVSQIIVGNTREYGGFTRITGDAYADDGLLDLCLFTANGPLSAGRQVASLLVRQQPSAASSEQYRATSAVVHAAGSMPLQLDGSDVDAGSDAGPHTYRFTLVPRGLTVLVPRTYGGEIFEHGLPSYSAKKKRKHKVKKGRAP
jgi:YegS/Rv2252/BmrU family lipid kinase